LLIENSPKSVQSVYTDVAYDIKAYGKLLMERAIEEDIALKKTLALPSKKPYRNAFF